MDLNLVYRGNCNFYLLKEWMIDLLSTCKSMSFNIEFNNHVMLKVTKYTLFVKNVSAYNTLSYHYVGKCKVK